MTSLDHKEITNHQEKISNLKSLAHQYRLRKIKFQQN